MAPIFPCLVVWMICWLEWGIKVSHYQCVRVNIWFKLVSLTNLSSFVLRIEMSSWWIFSLISMKYHSPYLLISFGLKYILLEIKIKIATPACFFNWSRKPLNLSWEYFPSTDAYTLYQQVQSGCCLLLTCSNQHNAISIMDQWNNNLRTSQAMMTVS